MKIKHALSYFWKLPLCGIAFFIGLALGGSLLTALGFAAPDSPAGTDPNTIALWFLLGSMLLTIPLSLISRRLKGGWLARSLTLFGLVWAVAAIGMVLESFFFMTTGAVSSLDSGLFTMLNFLLPCLLLSVVTAALFRPEPRPVEATASMPRNAYFSAYPTGGWALRIAGALIAYPITYILFGLLVQPYVEEFYSTGQYELVIPTWEEMVLLQVARSLLFLAVCLPVLVQWNGTRRSLWLSLGTSFFVLTAFMAVITAYWFPWQLRLFHGLELLADALVYVGALVILLYPRNHSE